MKPTFNNVFLQEEEQPESPIFIPTEVDKVPADRAIVVAVGPDVTVTKVGDTVLFKPYAFTKVQVDKEFLVGEDKNILAIL